MSATRLALGGAQFGLDYGVSNNEGKLTFSSARALLTAAWEAGVDMLDLAPAYGDAEQTVAMAHPAGASFRIVSKTRVGGARLEEIEAQARSSAALAGGRLDTLLAHHAADLQGADGDTLWSLLRRLKDEGVTRRIGFSAYCEDRPAALARRLRPDVVQLPLSFLDQRLIRSGELDAIKALDVEIHARSVYLQGLVFMKPATLPTKLAPIADRLGEIQTEIAAAGVDMVAAALGFALDLPAVDRVILGCAGATQLHEALDVAREPPPELDWSALRLDADWALSPANW